MSNKSESRLKLISQFCGLFASLGVIIWESVTNSKLDFWWTVLIIFCCTWTPYVLISIFITLRIIIQFIYRMVTKSVNKYILSALVIISILVIASFGVMAMYQLIAEDEVLTAATYFALFILGGDLVILTWDIQTEESRELLKDIIPLDDTDEEQKYGEENDDAASNTQSVTFLLYHLILFVVYVTGFLSMSFIFQEYESCFSNWANFGVANVVIWKWIKANKKFNIRSCWIWFAMVTVIAMIVISSASCSCKGDCNNWSIVMTVIVLIWSFFVYIYEKLYKKI